MTVTPSLSSNKDCNTEQYTEDFKSVLKQAFPHDFFSDCNPNLSSNKDCNLDQYTKAPNLDQYTKAPILDQYTKAPIWIPNLCLFPKQVKPV